LGIAPKSGQNQSKNSGNLRLLINQMNVNKNLLKMLTCSEVPELEQGIALELSDRGDRVGFIGKGDGLSTNHWLPTGIAQYFCAV